MLPLLEEVLARIERRRLEISRREAQLQVLDVLWGEKLRDVENPDHAEAAGHRAAMLEAAREIQRSLEEEVLARGVRFPQGGLEFGLMDFPTTWQGRWVYLCWHRGEPSVTAWHEVRAGFAGRQPLTREQRQRMGRDDDPAALDDSALDF